MGKFKLDWPGVVAFGLTIIASVVVGMFVSMEAATVLAGIAGGLLVKFGAVTLSSSDIDIEVEAAKEDRR